MVAALFEPIMLGALELRNRIVMAPMTRDRAGPGDVPGEIMVEYYRQRASAGLIVTEGVQPTPVGKGYWRTPGIHHADQIAGWRRVADAVHDAGGKIVMQLMHCGRVVVAANRGFDADVIAPSAIRCPALVPGPDGVPTQTVSPRALSTHEIPVIVAEFAQAARNALAAGIDGVELHSASGYLVNQFLNSASNTRTDQWGGSPAKRTRFAHAVLAAMAAAIGGDRVGFRISPGNPYNGMDAADPVATYVPLLEAIDDLGLAYVHVVDMNLDTIDTLKMVRDHWSGMVIGNNMLKADSAAALLADGRADLASFGRAFIANPDLVERFQSGAPIAKPDYARLYTGDAEGYIDYPALTR